VPTPKKQFSLFPTGLKIALALVHRFSERLTLQLLYRLFFTPRPYRMPEREQTFALAWLWTNVATPWGVLPVAHSPAIGKSQGSIFLLHGWSGRPTQLGALVVALNRAGFDCTLPTAPGHRSGDHKSSSLKDFAEFAYWMNLHHGPYNAAIGHSLGAAALLLSRSPQSAWPKTVAISSFAKTERVFQEFVRQSGLPERYVQRLLKRVEEELGASPSGYSPHLAPFPGPTLLIHDKDDVEVPFSDAEILANCLPLSQLVSTEGLGHRKILGRPETWEAVLGYIGK
jgi:pimeloyl-ACP methyl ester carboxylesterase